MEAIETRVDKVETEIAEAKSEIVDIKNYCGQHRLSTREVFNEILCIKEEVKHLKATLVEIKEVKKALDGVMVLLERQFASLSRRRVSVRWVAIGLMTMVIFWLFLSVAEGRFLLF